MLVPLVVAVAIVVVVVVVVVLFVLFVVVVLFFQIVLFVVLSTKVRQKRGNPTKGSPFFHIYRVETEISQS